MKKLLKSTNGYYKAIIKKENGYYNITYYMFNEVCLFSPRHRDIRSACRSIITEFKKRGTDIC